MLRAIWYFIKIAAIVGIAIVLASQAGTVVVEWRDYTVTIQLGFVAAGLFLAFWVIFLASALATRITLWPRELMRAHHERQRVKGYKVLLQSVTAAAIGDHRTAYAMAQRAQKLLPDTESGLPLLLQARSQPDNVQDHDELYLSLVQNADTALLGLQGLTQKAILAGDFEKALLLARQSVANHPKNPSLLKALYELELKNYHWSDALVTLDKAVRAKVIDKPKAAQDRVALYIALGDMAQKENRTDESFEFYKLAVKHSPDMFVPAIVRLVQAYITREKLSKAQGLIEKSWRIQPHPELMAVWNELWDKQPSKQKAGRLAWVKNLTRYHEDSLDSHLAQAQAAINDGLWGEARVALAQAEKIAPVAAVYQLWVQLEEKTTNKPEVIRQWLDRAHASAQGAGWICARTGRHMPGWVPVLEPERLFNTLVWSKEGHGVFGADISVLAAPAV